MLNFLAIPKKYPFEINSIQNRANLLLKFPKIDF